MAISWVHLLVPIAALSINAFVQILVCRLMPQRGLLYSIYAGFAAGILVLAVAEIGCFNRESEERWALLLANAMIYAAFGYGYFHFLNLGETARRIRILREIEGAPLGLSIEDILGRYNAAMIVERRLGRLLKTGQIELRNGRYRIARTGVLRMARVVQVLRWILCGRQGSGASQVLGVESDTHQ